MELVLLTRSEIGVPAHRRLPFSVKSIEPQRKARVMRNKLTKTVHVSRRKGRSLHQRFPGVMAFRKIYKVRPNDAEL